MQKIVWFCEFLGQSQTTWVGVKYVFSKKPFFQTTILIHSPFPKMGLSTRFRKLSSLIKTLKCCTIINQSNERRVRVLPECYIILPMTRNHSLDNDRNNRRTKMVNPRNARWSWRKFQVNQPVIFAAPNMKEPCKLLKSGVCGEDAARLTLISIRYTVFYKPNNRLGTATRPS